MPSILQAIHRAARDGETALTFFDPGLTVLPDVLARLTGLETLDLTDCWALKDLRPLAALTRLRVLHLRGCPVRDLRPLAALPRLAALDVPTGH
jgi:Leucine-rich repeat (LRR) protein